MQNDRTNIIHINVTDFAAAVAIAKDRQLAQRPFAIALEGSARRVVIAPSRMAWEEGIRPGMSVLHATYMVPGLQLLAPDNQAIAKADAAIASIAQRYSPHVQSDRGGHVYLDMQGTTRLFGPAMDSAVRIRREIREQLTLEGAVAVATNKLVAKIGTRTIRPAGITQIQEGEEASFLAQQEVRLLSGVGSAIGNLLAVAGIKNIGQLAALEDGEVLAFLGKRGLALRNAARGMDTSPLYQGPGEQKAIVRKVYFAEPVFAWEALQASVVAAAEDAGLQMRSERFGCSAVHLTLFFSDGQTSEAARRTKQQWVFDHELEPILCQTALQALQRRVQLLGFTLRLADLRPVYREIDLFLPQQSRKQEVLQTTIDQVRKRFGIGILSHATALHHG